MKGFALLAAFAVFLIMVFAVGYALGRHHADNSKTFSRVSEKKVELFYDTSFIELPVPRDSIVVRYVKATLPLKGPGEKTETDMAPAAGVPALAGGEMAEVEVPIMQKEYADSTYRAWISGYMASLDSIEIYNKTQLIEETIFVTSRKRWGFTVGPSVGGGWNGRNFSPYIGVGITWGFSF